MADKYFDRREAEELLPTITPWLEEARDEKQKIEAFKNELAQVASRIMVLGGTFPPLADLLRKKSEHDKAADLSGNRRFERLIVAAAPHFDWIVVDSSPVNLVSDGVNLARACDAVLLVARGGVTKYESAQRALGELKASKVLGFVLNAVKNPPVAGGYYGYDGYDKIEE